MKVSLLVQCLFEFIGTFVLVLLGCGVVACVSLRKSKGEGAGWVVVTLAWGLAVMCGVLIAGPYTGAHLNPAVTLGLAAAGKFPWEYVLPYIVSQIAGGILGAVIVYVFYKDHFDATAEAETKLGVFATIPAIKNYRRNMICEIVGTFILVLVILFMGDKENSSEVGLGSVGALPVALLVVVIGMSLGGTTGYAINPARDLGPRIAHAILPIKGKGSSQWSYSWVPIVGPLLGGVLAALLYLLVKELM
ncbi:MULTISPECIES: MIP/aquaporin family protein [Muribaculum]|jgi:glycerol uptake facilitator protein|uniref:Aquaporin family protein n=4 Tax=Muribaculum TaxID=1918540 RepID=A0A4P7VK79_9BACT|nr:MULTISPECIES: MIP/aquaporin family protein [Muribaculum]QCD36113.1 aquaporin family protein [Muribaculum gordoncarteri]TGY03579.1 aquaporin family protein [Muribaculum sp. NM65_B17]THG42550.1 aquaporin family protein [Muribaculaceae bacterium]